MADPPPSAEPSRAARYEPCATVISGAFGDLTNRLDAWGSGASEPCAAGSAGPWGAGDLPARDGRHRRPLDGTA